VGRHAAGVACGSGTRSVDNDFLKNSHPGALCLSRTSAT